MVRCILKYHYCGELYFEISYLWWDVPWDTLIVVRYTLSYSYCGEMYLEMFLLWWDYLEKSLLWWDVPWGINIMVRCTLKYHCCGELYLEISNLWCDVRWDIVIVVRCTLRYPYCGEMYLELSLLCWDVPWDVAIVVRYVVWFLENMWSVRSRYHTNDGSHKLRENNTTFWQRAFSKKSHWKLRTNYLRVLNYGLKVSGFVLKFWQFIVIVVVFDI